MLISLLIKLGAAPFHFWLPEILTKIRWNNRAILITWQKVAPILIINNINYNNKIIYISIIISVIVGALGGLNQISLRKIIGYSSINHLGWIISLRKIKNNWIYYLRIYAIIVVSICWIFHQYNIIHINQINNMNITIIEKLTYLTSILRLGGLPPFLGFLPKWLVIQTLVEDTIYIIITIIIIIRLLRLFYYIRTITKIIITFSLINKWIIIKSNKKIINMIIIINVRLPLILIINLI